MEASSQYSGKAVYRFEKVYIDCPFYHAKNGKHGWNDETVYGDIPKYGYYIHTAHFSTQGSESKVETMKLLKKRKVIRNFGRKYWIFFLKGSFENLVQKFSGKWFMVPPPRRPSLRPCLHVSKRRGFHSMGNGGRSGSRRPHGRYINTSSCLRFHCVLIEKTKSLQLSNCIAIRS